MFESPYRLQAGVEGGAVEVNEIFDSGDVGNHGHQGGDLIGAVDIAVTVGWRISCIGQGGVNAHMSMLSFRELMIAIRRANKDRCIKSRAGSEIEALNASLL